jgi:hypothetical protein
VGPRAGLDEVAKRKKSRHCPCWELNSDRPAHGLASVLTELPRLHGAAITVSKMTSHEMNGRVSIFGSGTDFSPRHRVHKGSGTHTNPGSFLGVKLPKSETNNLPLSSKKV